MKDGGPFEDQGERGPFLFKCFGLKVRKGAFRNCAADLDGIAANFAILHISLLADGKIENHRDLFSAVWAHEMVFHV